jgi:hypothetical protein
VGGATALTGASASGLQLPDRRRRVLFAIRAEGRAAFINGGIEA